MIIGKHINRYYLKFGWVLLLGLAALVAVDYFQLMIPNLYQMVINGVNQGYVEIDGQQVAFDLDAGPDLYAYGWGHSGYCGRTFFVAAGLYGQRHPAGSGPAQPHV